MLILRIRDTKITRKHNMTRKLMTRIISIITKRTRLLPLKRLQITFLTFQMNFQCKWMLWSIDSKTIIHLQA